MTIDDLIKNGAPTDMVLRDLLMIVRYLKQRVEVLEAQERGSLDSDPDSASSERR